MKLGRGSGLLKIAMAATLTMPALVLNAVASPGVAEARCAGAGNPITSTFYRSGATRVMDDPVSGTCDGNSAYTFVLRDPTTDGYCVRAIFSDGGQTRYASTCADAEQFVHHDVNGNSNANEQLCYWNQQTSYCGWGTTSNGWGDNYGY